MTDHITTTTADVMIPEVWGPKLNDFFRANLKAGSFFEDWSEDVAAGGDIAHRPNISEMTAQNKTVGSQVVLSAPTETKVDLTINTHKMFVRVKGIELLEALKRVISSQVYAVA